MKINPIILSVILVFWSGALHAACYADYKAKQDNPLRLHYGVVQLSDSNCSKGAAADLLRDRLTSDGWTLLNVVSVFDESKLEEKKANAGPFFLRY